MVEARDYFLSEEQLQARSEGHSCAAMMQSAGRRCDPSGREREVRGGPPCDAAAESAPRARRQGTVPTGSPACGRGP
ncbi:hypothetical protein [Streptomyces sp. NPDC051636]|uniref:hypothetical protein n=1 Tax=Streptomyces sp. NPDC051636 TaxID=3365663 RepID=UPI0037ADA5F2